MAFCKNCGAQLSEGTVFCQSCGASTREPSRPALASAGWGARFVAWLIDVIIIGIFLTPTKLFLAFFGLSGLTLPILPAPLSWIPFVEFGLDNVVYFLYWTIMDGTFGQSVGKMAMHLKVTRLNGQPIDVGTAAVESFGKAFMLPLDCILGWILYQNQNKRLFNSVSGTTVVRL